MRTGAVHDMPIEEKESRDAEKKGDKTTMEAFADMWRTEWVDKKRDIAHRLNSGRMRWVLR